MPDPNPRSHRGRVDQGSEARRLRLQPCSRLGAGSKSQCARSWPSGSSRTCRRILDLLAAEVAGPGFINFQLRAEAKADIVDQILGQGTNYGAPTARQRATHPDRIRLCQPDRPPACRTRPRSRARLLPRPDSRSSRPYGRMRILHQRRRATNGHSGDFRLAALPGTVRRTRDFSGSRIPGRLYSGHRGRLPPCSWRRVAGLVRKHPGGAHRTTGRTEDGHNMYLDFLILRARDFLDETVWAELASTAVDTLLERIRRDLDHFGAKF